MKVRQLLQVQILPNPLEIRNGGEIGKLHFAGFVWKIGISWKKL
jgi:hypothetical protein